MSAASVSPRVHAGLDAIRALAACYVIAHHVAQFHAPPGHLALLFKFGQEAVLLFFLLSGFVIFASERDRAHDYKSYILRRIRRIYPPLIVAMMVSTLVFAIAGKLGSHFSIKNAAATVFALQDIERLKPGVVDGPYLGNDPLWSLSYELAFYAVFPLALSAWKRFRDSANIVIGLLCFLSYVSYVLFPNHFSLVTAYFMIWWTGAMIADAYLNGARSFLALRSTLPFLCALAALSCIVVLIVGYDGIYQYPGLQARHFIVAVSVVVIGFSPLGRMIIRVLTILPFGLTKLAAISYGLYVLHYPLLVQLPWTSTILGFSTAVLGLIGLAYAVEQILPRHLPRAPRTINLWEDDGAKGVQGHAEIKQGDQIVTPR